MNPEDENEDYYGPCSDIVYRALGKIDVAVFVRCEGTLVLFTSITLRAKEWSPST